MPRTLRDEQELTILNLASDPIDATLYRILGQVNDWLKFAEAKNGGVVGLVSAAIAVLLAYLSDVDRWRPLAGGVLALGGACLLLSLLVGLASFFPRVGMWEIVEGRQGTPATDDNLYYFGHLAAYSPRHLVEAVARRYLDARIDTIEEAHLALASQIIVNARITLWKLRLFGIAVALFGTGVVVAAVGVALTVSA